jgi:hypothetical protein
MKKMCLILIGNIRFPEDFKQIFTPDGAFLITRNLGKDCCFEMSGESMFYALCELEKANDNSLFDYKKRIIEAVDKRIIWGNGKLLHRSLTGNYDIQFRSTNSALRTLLYACNSGFKTDDNIRILANEQFKHFFHWKEGIWFCHDSSEYNGKTPISHIRSRVAGKSWRNTLTLNTHIDSLNTLLLLKQYEKEHLLDFDLEYMINKGLTSINQLLELVNEGRRLNKLQVMDNYYLNQFLKEQHNTFLIDCVYEKIIHPVIFKFIFPTIFFNNGFIARDLSVLNRHIDYQLVNIVDLARLLNLYKQIEETKLLPTNVLRFKDIEDKLERAIAFIENNELLLNYIKSDELQMAWYAEMYYAMSSINLKYIEKARNLYSEQLYCSESPFYKMKFHNEKN